MFSNSSKCFYGSSRERQMSKFSTLVVSACLASLVIGSPFLEKKPPKKLDPKLVRLLLSNDFESGSMEPWYDESPGETHWVVENSSFSQEPTPAPAPSSGENYLRINRPDGYVSGLGVLYTPIWTANPGDNLTLSFWIRSRHTQGNTLDIYWINGTREEKLLGLSSFSTSSNFQWRTAEASIPVSNPTNTQLVIYGFCGPNEEDSIAIDNIVISSANSSSTSTTALFTTSVDTSYSSVDTTTYVPGGDCRYVLNGSSAGAFSSPNYPNPYSDNLNCEWLIMVPFPYERIYLHFTDFELEATYDKVEVYDGPSSGYPLLSSHSGDIRPPDVYSTYNAMLVKFTTDSSITLSGFSARYSGFMYSASTTESWLTSPEQSGCGGYLSGWGTFSSSNYPGDYDPNTDCFWRLESNYDYVYLRMDDFATELNYDKVIVYEGWDTSGEIRALWSGTCSSDECLVTSKGRRMLVRFITDGSNNYRGFYASFGSSLNQ